MNRRLAVLVDSETIAADKTYTLDLAGHDAISAIFIQVKGKNSSNTPAGHPAKMVTSIQLVDGSNILHSYNGLEAQAADYYHRKMTPFNSMSYVNDNYCTALLTMHFGRRFGDTELAFAPGKYSNPQLKFTVDIDAGGSSPDAVVVEVVADVFDEKIVSPVGFLALKKHYDYTLVASAYESINLPVDQVMRTLYIKSLTAGYQPHQQYNNIRLSEDHLKRVVFENSTSDLIKYLLQNYPTIVESCDGRIAASGVAHYITPTYEVNAAVSGIGGYTDDFTTSDEYGGRITVNNASGTKSFQAVVKGQIPHGMIAIPFGDPDDMSDWYDLRKVTSEELRILAGSGCSGTCEILVQQLIRY